MLEKRKEECSKNGLESETVIFVSNTPEKTIDTIKEKKIDLTVMVKRRKLKEMKKLLSLGSVSRKIIENTSCPVLLMDVEK